MRDERTRSIAILHFFRQVATNRNLRHFNEGRDGSGINTRYFYRFGTGFALTLLASSPFESIHKLILFRWGTNIEVIDFE
jgi:hypothetical protein